MSIVKEFYKTRNDGINLYKTYSNEGYIIHKLNTEEYYSEALDVENTPFEYEETEEKIETEEISEVEQKAQSFQVCMEDE